MARVCMPLSSGACEAIMQTASTLMRIVAVALLLYALSTFTTAVRDVDFAEQTIAQLEQDYNAALQKNEELAESMERAQSDEGIEALVRDRLGLVMPGEKIYYFTKGDGVG